MDLPGNIVIKKGYLKCADDAVLDWVTQSIEGSSIYTFFANEAEKWMKTEGDWMVLKDRITGESIMASEILDLSKKFAAFFKGKGIQPGDVVHVIIGNHNLTHAISFGLWILGAIISPGDINLEPRSVAHQLRESRAKLVICQPQTAGLLKEAFQILEKESIKIPAFSLGNTDDFEDILGTVKGSTEDCPVIYQHENPMEAVCVLFWTSGTTGVPKAIQTTCSNILNFPAVMNNYLVPKTNVFSTTCFFHVGGFHTALVAFKLKQTFHHMFGAGFTLEKMVSVIKEIKATAIAVGTHHYVQMSEAKDIWEKYDPKDFENTSIIFPAGAAVPASCEISLRKYFPNLQGVMNAYGQTESGLVILGFDPSIMGTIITRAVVKIVKEDTREPCGPGEEGEICVKRPDMMAGYLNKPLSTYFDDEGFGKTGDIGVYDENGVIRYLDRCKELIKYKNNHIAPTELEDIMQRHPAVKESLAFGKEDPAVQELVSFAVVKNQGFEDVTEEDLISYLDAEVTDFKRIRGGLTFMENLPRNSVGKLTRRVLRQQFKV